MSATSLKCPKCDSSVPFNETHCHCGTFIGFPNVRRAAQMRTALLYNYDQALANAGRSDIGKKIDALDSILRSSVASLSISVRLLRNLSMGDDYTSYYTALDSGHRQIAEAKYHAHRESVDAKIHTGYVSKIINAALSPDGKGLPNYGSIALTLRSITIEDRSTILRENAFDFYDTFDLGRRDAVEPPGWRAVWADRNILGIAFKGPIVSSSTPTATLSQLVMSAGAGRQADRFMEVHIFGRLDWQAIETATVQTALTTPEDRDDWQFSQAKLTRRGVLCRPHPNS